jgi:hypothetical protein
MARRLRNCVIIYLGTLSVRPDLATATVDGLVPATAAAVRPARRKAASPAATEVLLVPMAASAPCISGTSASGGVDWNGAGGSGGAGGKAIVGAANVDLDDFTGLIVGSTA